MTEAAAWPDAGEAADHVRAVVARSGTTFHWGMRLLPAARRAGMYALYAFCREVDDIADEPGDVTRRQSQLEGWRTEIERLYAGEPTTAISRALADPIARYHLPRQEFLAIIDGMAMDLDGAMVAPTEAELESYCRRVAGAVGLLSIRIFGAAQAEDIAIELGRALQLTNILRDLHEDGARGRLYLPRERLHAHGITDTEPRAVLAHPNVAPVCAELADEARASFDRVRESLRRSDRRRLRACIVMMNMYERILDRLVRRGWQRLDRRISLPPVLKLWIVLRHGLF